MFWLEPRTRALALGVRKGYTTHFRSREKWSSQCRLIELAYYIVEMFRVPDNYSMADYSISYLGLGPKSVPGVMAASELHTRKKKYILHAIS